MSYSAYVLTDASRTEILRQYPPSYDTVIAHHVTYKFPDTQPPLPHKKAMVVGYTANDRIEALIVEIDGSTRRPGGGIFHITMSLDADMGAKPLHANALIANDSYFDVDPFEIELTGELL